jgi:hypothetical protein
MQDWWKYNGPPAYMAVAGYLGLIKKRPSGTNGEAKYGDLEELAQFFSGSGGVISVE